MTYDSTSTTCTPTGTGTGTGGTISLQGLQPWVRGFNGDIDRVEHSAGITYRTRGNARRLNNTSLEITGKYSLSLCVCVCVCGYGLGYNPY